MPAAAAITHARKPLKTSIATVVFACRACAVIAAAVDRTAEELGSLQTGDAKSKEMPRFPRHPA